MHLVIHFIIHSQGHGTSQMCCQSRCHCLGDKGLEKVHKQIQNGVRIESGQDGVTSVTL